MAWEATNPVTFNRLGRVDDWNKLWDNADYITTDVLHLSGVGSTDVIGGDGTPASFQKLRGTSSTATVDVTGSADELTLAGGSVTATGAGLDSNLTLFGSGSGSGVAARLRLADLGNNAFTIDDHSGTRLYTLIDSSFIGDSMNLIRAASDTVSFSVQAGGSNQGGAQLLLRGYNVTTGGADSARLYSTSRDTNRTGIGFYDWTGAGTSERMAFFDRDQFEFYNPLDNNDSVDLTPSSAKAEGFVGGTSSWIIQNGDFRVGQTSNNYVLWDENLVEFRGFNSGAARWRMQEFGLSFNNGATTRSNYSSTAFMVTDSSGSDEFGYDSLDNHLTWASTASAGGSNQAWIDTTSATNPRLYYNNGTITRYVELDQT